MSRKRTKVGKKIIENLKREAGGKCANPGCPTRRTHIHHIQEWSVYKTHDEKHMIAVCPTCHDDIHHGAIQLSDETIYRWKEIVRLGDVIRGQLYVEPNGFTKLLVGRMGIIAPMTVAVFYLSEGNYLRFDLRDELLFLNLRIASYKGKEILRVTNNHVCLDINPLIEYREVTGHIQITAPANHDYIPEWVIEQMLLHYPAFVLDGKVIVLSLNVLGAGLVKIRGVWAESERAVVISDEAISFLRPTFREPMSLIADEGVVLSVGAQPINERSSLFGIP